MTEAKERIRPVLEINSHTEDKSVVEKFQNITLRPIIKLQHGLLVAFFENYLICKRIDLTSSNSKKKDEIMSRIFKNDNAFKKELRGLIIGHFTLTEYQNYLPIAAEANKRMMAMISQRLTSDTN